MGSAWPVGIQLSSQQASMELNRRLRLPLLAGLIGCATAAALICIWHQTHTGFVLWILVEFNWLSHNIAYQITGWIFRADRIGFGWMTNATLYECLYVLLTGLQTAIVGAFIKWLASKRRR